MKNLILLIMFLMTSSVWAIDDGTYILKTAALKDQYAVTEGYQLQNGKFRSLDVTINYKGIESAYFRGSTYKSYVAFLGNSEFATTSKTTGLNTIYCNTQYGVAYSEGEALIVKRWNLEKEANFGCPISKNPFKRGLKNGKKNESMLIFTQKENTVYVQFSSNDKPRKLIRIR
jgi:hypothetical protein